MKKSITIIISIVMLLVTVFALTACGNEINFKDVVTELLGSEYTDYFDYFTFGEDGSFMEFDTNPYNIDDYFDAKAISILEELTGKLGFPSYVYQEMIGTTAMQGKQEASIDGLTVNWTYHPDKGLEAIFKKV